MPFSSSFHYPNNPARLSKVYSDEEVIKALEEIGFSVAPQRVFALTWNKNEKLIFNDKDELHREIKKYLGLRSQNLGTDPVE